MASRVWGSTTVAVVTRYLGGMCCIVSLLGIPDI